MITTQTPTISIVIPIFNEAEVLPLLISRLLEAAPNWEVAYEILFIDDGSSDQSVSIIQNLTASRSNFRIVKLSRNFGHQAAISAGIDHALGKAVILMDGDLQDPPEILREFILKWQEGFDVVYAIRQKRKEGWAKRIAYKVFYRLLKKISNLEIPLDSGDFCLMDRKVVNVIKDQLPENVRFVRGLRTFAGFRQTGLAYERDKRAAGEAKYTFRKLIGLALDGIFGFSLVPLRIASYMGLLIAIPSFLLGIFFIIHRIFDFKIFGYSPTDTPGLASLATGIFFIGGITLIILGIIGEYLGRIYLEVKKRPSYIVDEVIEKK